MSSQSNPKLEGHVAVIVGASRRSGREAAIGLAEDGAHVVVTARQSRDEIDAVVADIVSRGGSAEARLMEVTDPASVEGTFRAIADAHGRLDALVCNAAIRRQAPFLEISLEGWREIIATNLDGVFLCCQAALRTMVEARTGTIVTVGGVSAHIGAVNRAHVCASKAAVVGLTRALAVEFAPFGITVNCVAPGKIGGERAATAGASPIDSNRIPLGREGTVQEAASVIRYLCQPEARFITGQTLHVSGGLFMP